MTRRRVLFVTDDRESYALGNYYLAYQRGFLRRADVTLHHPLQPAPDPTRFDLVVLGHAAIETYTRMRGGRFLPSALTSLRWMRHGLLRALRAGATPCLLFTKNDYRQFPLKNDFIAYVRPDLVVTHTRQALEHLRAAPGGRIMWLPFGIDIEQFRPPEAPVDLPSRRFVIGFRARHHRDWNAGERERFFAALGRLETRYPVSLTLSDDGEGFLLGQPYVEWMGSCALLGNTVSALGTVGPRFLEAMACGTVPLAPRNAYEDLLVPDVHYVAVDPGPDESFPGLEGEVARFLGDAAYRRRMVDGGRALADEHSVDRHVLRLLDAVGVGHA